MNHATCRRGGNCRLGFAGAAIAPTLPRNRTLTPLPGEGLVGRPCPSCNETLRHQFVPDKMYREKCHVIDSECSSSIEAPRFSSPSLRRCAVDE
ncbi:hypothetical protein EJB05_30925, partial [Eragrostis curvula]